MEPAHFLQGTIHAAVKSSMRQRGVVLKRQ
jgi:hypothetical protein